MVDERRALRAPRRHLVVTRIERALRARGADRNRERRDTRRRDAAHHQLAVGRLAVVAGRCDDHEAGLHRALDRETNRVVLVALRRCRTQREVDHADAELVAIPDRPVDRFDDVRGFTGSVRIQHLEVDQVRGRRHPRIRALAAVVEGPRGDDAGDVRAVTVVVVASAVRIGKVDVRDDAVLQRGMICNAAVDHRHADAAAVDLAERRDLTRQRGVRARDGRGQRHRRTHNRIGRHHVDFIVERQRIELRGRDAEHRAGRQLLLDPQSMTLGNAVDLLDRATDNHIDVTIRRRLEAGRQIRRQPRPASRRLRRSGERHLPQQADDENGGDVPDHAYGAARPDDLLVVLHNSDSPVGCVQCCDKSALSARPSFRRPNPSAPAAIRRASGWCEDGHRGSGSKRCGATSPGFAPPARCSPSGRPGGGSPAGCKSGNERPFQSAPARFVMAGPVPDMRRLAIVPLSDCIHRVCWSTMRSSGSSVAASI